MSNQNTNQLYKMQSAQLSLFSGIAEALANNKKIEDILENLLAICLEAAGIEEGVVYLFNANGKLISQQTLGRKKIDPEKIEINLGRSQILTEMFTRKKEIKLPSPAFPDHINQQFLKEGELTSAVLEPMLMQEICLGALLLGSRTENIINDEIISFARALSKQLAQSLALTNTLKHVTSTKRHYQALMDNASCIFIVGTPQGIILEINKEGEKALNLPKEKIINQNIRNFIEPSDITTVETILKKIPQEKKIGLSEIKFKRAGKKEIYTAEFSVNEIKIESENYLLVTANDVTERNHLKAEKILADRLSTVGTLAAGIAHEINTPVAWTLSNFIYIQKQLEIIKIFAHQLHKLSQETDDKKKLEELNRISADPTIENILTKCNAAILESIEGTERIQKIVLDLKGYIHQDDTTSESTNIHNTLDSALKITADEYRNHAQIIKQYASNIPNIFINSGKLHQAFVNIILNAAQAIPTGDPTHNKITISTSLQKKHIQIDISDTGTGIKPDILPRIFDPFFTTKVIGIGTGLGLSISNEIVRHLGGEIKVTTQVGKGSTFSISIPIKREK